MNFLRWITSLWGRGQEPAEDAPVDALDDRFDEREEAEEERAAPPEPRSLDPPDYRPVTPTPGPGLSEEPDRRIEESPVELEHFDEQPPGEPVIEQERRAALDAPAPRQSQKGEAWDQIMSAPAIGADAGTEGMTRQDQFDAYQERLEPARDDALPDRPQPQAERPIAPAQPGDAAEPADPRIADSGDSGSIVEVLERINKSMKEATEASRATREAVEQSQDILSEIRDAIQEQEKQPTGYGA